MIMMKIKKINKYMKTWEDYFGKMEDVNISESFEENGTIDATTKLKVIRDWTTPYNSNFKNTVATAEYWASKLGKDADTFVKDFNAGSLNSWFQIINE
jgi:hypothetical protein